MIKIRKEMPNDIDAIRSLNELAFGQHEEADIVDFLRKKCDEMLSFVAIDDDEIVGHICFSPAIVKGPEGIIKGMGLAPMAVLPDRQRHGIGSATARYGLEFLKDAGCPFVIVLGHAKYYPRFGFKPASHYGLKSQWDGIPDDVFMAIVFDRALMDGVSGIVRYREEFDAAV
jgi:putative acetyltransferase